MARHLLTVFLLLLTPMVYGTHVLGGEMYYDHLGGDQYLITLKLYRDCGPGNVNNTAFDASAQIAVYDGNGIFQFSVSPPFTGEQVVPVNLSSPCLQAPPTICATWAEYTAVITLPPNSSGYVLSYQRCCRTPTISNLPTGVLQGLTCTVQIPPASFGSNSSPRFDEYPAIAMCLGEDMVIDHSATDPDGDVLVYDLFTPFAGGDAFDPAPLAGPPPYAGILWAPGYSGASPMDGAPGLAIDAATGEMTIHPTLLGSYAAAVRVREYRNGELVSATIRDLRFDVVACDAFISAAIAAQVPEDLCAGTTIAFENESVNGESWFWDLGVPGTDADTSRLIEPIWTYADTGTYTVTLVVNPGWPCADTSTAIYRVHYPLDPYFIRPIVRCVDQAVPFMAQGNFTADAIVQWAFDAAQPASDVGVQTSATFGSPGTHAVQFTVQEFGCSASYSDSATVHPRIELEVLTDTAGCVEAEFFFAASAQAWTPVTYTWVLGDAAVLNGQNTSFIYLDPGVYDVGLTARTDSGCVDTKSIWLTDHVHVFPKPVAAFTVYPTEVSLLDPVVEVTDHSELAVTWAYTIGTDQLTEPSFTYEFDDAGVFEVTQTVVSGANCSASETRSVHVSDHLFFAPTAFTPDGDGLNDVFLPRVKGARLYELVIMDRWGTELFHTNDPKAGWDGAGLPQGVFTFKARLSEFGPMNKEYVGHFTLLR